MSDRSPEVWTVGGHLRIPDMTQVLYRFAHPAYRSDPITVELLRLWKEEPINNIVSVAARGESLVVCDFDGPSTEVDVTGQLSPELRAFIYADMLEWQRTHPDGVVPAVFASLGLTVSR